MRKNHQSPPASRAAGPLQLPERDTSPILVLVSVFYCKSGVEMRKSGRHKSFCACRCLLARGKVFSFEFRQ